MYIMCQIECTNIEAYFSHRDRILSFIVSRLIYGVLNALTPLCIIFSNYARKHTFVRQIDKKLHIYKTLGVINHPCPNFNGGVAKPSLKSGRGHVYAHNSMLDV